MSAEPVTSVPAEAPSREVPGSSSPVGIDVRELPWIRPLMGDYAFDFEKIAALYAGNPALPQAWRDAVARRHAHSASTLAIADVLAAQQAQRGAPREALDAAAALADPRTVAIVTGQQAGAFGGPLFTLLKAVTAIQLARRASADLGIPAVAVFWVDAEDHDWEEVRSCTVLDAEFQPSAVTLADLEGAGELPVAALTLDQRIEESLTALFASLPDTDFSEALAASLRAAYRPGNGMAAAFATWIEALLGKHGLVVFESADPAAKQLAAPVFLRELREPGRTSSLALAAGQQLAERGHEPQVMPQPDNLALFHLNGVRRAIRRQGNQFVIGDAHVTAEALVREAETDPTRFSPNVLLRPIVQDTLFPTICYVAGPSELAYLGQLGGIYRHFDVPMPLMFPRGSATLVDSATARFLSKYDFPLADLRPQDESGLNRLLQAQLPPEVEQSLADADATIRAALQRVNDAMPALDPTLAGAAKTTVGKMEHDLRSLHSKVIQAAKRRDDTLRRQFTRAQAQIFPLGHPQERTLGVVFFLNRYGPALVDRLLQDLPVEMGRHWVLTI
ncbi:MAG: bacillithiol synthase [Acidobacteriota bacterium]